MSKGQLYKKIGLILLGLILIIYICVLLISCDNNSTPQNNSSNDSSMDTSLSSPSSVLPFEMELVGESSEGYFKYYRDTTTDVLYIKQAQKIGYAGIGGLTVMLDPETGLPMLYDKYIELYEKMKE